MDLFHNGQAFGSVAKKLFANGMNPALLKPYIGADGQAYITQRINGKNVAVPIKANATLRKDEWKEMDKAVLKAAEERLVGVADLYNRDLVYRIGNGLGKTVLEYLESIRLDYL